MFICLCGGDGLEKKVFCAINQSHRTPAFPHLHVCPGLVYSAAFGLSNCEGGGHSPQMFLLKAAALPEIR